MYKQRRKIFKENLMNLMLDFENNNLRNFYLKITYEPKDSFLAEFPIILENILIKNSRFVSFLTVIYKEKGVIELFFCNKVLHTEKVLLFKNLCRYLDTIYLCYAKDFVIKALNAKQTYIVLYNAVISGFFAR